MLPLIQKIVLYIFVLIAIYIFVKTSELEINAKKIISLKYRILLALFFPFVLIIGLLLSSVIIAIVLVMAFIIVLYLKFFRRNTLGLLIKRK